MNKKRGLFLGFVIATLLVINSVAQLMGKTEPKTNPLISVSLEEGPYAEWHHLGDKLVIKYGNETLLNITLVQATDYQIPLNIAIGEHGHIFKWAEEMKDRSLVPGVKTYTLLNCSGNIVQQYSSVLWATFDTPNKNSGDIILALPSEDISHWEFSKRKTRSVSMTRKVDACYISLLKNGCRKPKSGTGSGESTGTWSTVARNCVIYIDDGHQYRQFNVSLPWPIVNPPGTGFRSK